MSDGDAARLTTRVRVEQACCSWCSLSCRDSIISTDDGLHLLFFPSQHTEIDRMAADPVHPDFDSADADIVLRSAETVIPGGTIKQGSQLFKVRKDSLCMSSVFRDMFETCGEVGKHAADEGCIQLQEGVFELHKLLLAHDEDIRRHPDLTDLSCAQLLALADVAIKYNVVVWQKSLEITIECAAVNAFPATSDPSHQIPFARLRHRQRTGSRRMVFTS